MSLAAKKSGIRTFSNQGEWISVPYIFADDTGATGDYDIVNFAEDCVVLDFYADFQVAFTGAGTSVMDLGVDDGGTEFWSNKALVTGGVSQTTINTISGMDTAAPVRVPADSEIVMSIDTAAVTAGQVMFNFFVKKQ